MNLVNPSLRCYTMIEIHCDHHYASASSFGKRHSETVRIVTREPWENCVNSSLWFIRLLRHFEEKRRDLTGLIQLNRSVAHRWRVTNDFPCLSLTADTIRRRSKPIKIGHEVEGNGWRSVGGRASRTRAAENCRRQVVKLWQQDLIRFE